MERSVTRRVVIEVLRRIVVVDSELTHFGRHAGHSALSCAAEVAAKLLQRNALHVPRLGLIAVGAARMVAAEGLGNGLPQELGRLLGLPGVAGVEVHAFCASGNAAVRQAVLTLETGRADVALVIGVDHVLAVQDHGPLSPEAAPIEARHGFSPPVFYGLCADRYLYENGVKPEDLAQVAVTNRRLGTTNSKARFSTPVTLSEVLASRPIAPPLTLLQCCPQADGAGALLLAARDAVRLDDHTTMEIVGLGSASADPYDLSLTGFSEDRQSSAYAYEEASVSPADIDVAEVHDAFTIAQIIHLEDLGLAQQGRGWRQAVRPDTGPVINPSGGLLARGHPLGATGIAQFDSVRRYLSDSRRDSKRRRYGLVHEAGGLRATGQMLSECAVVVRGSGIE